MSTLVSTISVIDIIEDGFFMTTDDGKAAHKHIKKAFARALKEKGQLEISFRGARHIHMSFLHSAIGDLYRKYTDRQIRRTLVVTDMEENDRGLLARAIRGTKADIKDPEGTKRYHRILKEVIAEYS